MLGASALKGARLARHGLPAESVPPLAAGAFSAFLSTLLSARLLRRPAHALLPYSLYRLLLAALVLARPRGRYTPDTGRSKKSG
jgi:undecaprenyl pyrophosphate phosphatase UppP